MEYTIILIIAFGASLLTFFSGFGLGTILLPAFTLIFPPELAIAATAVVHFLNNIFKLGLIGRHAALKVVLRFGLPAIAGAFIGARLLAFLADFHGDATLEIIPDQPVTWMNFLIGLLIIVFALFELLPSLRNLEFSTRWLLPGGLISGFFGGLSGHQGALRSAFLIRLRLPKESFVATGIVIACLIDSVRITEYIVAFDFQSISDRWDLLLLATISAFLGALLGRKMLKKVTFDFLQYTVGIMMMLIGIMLATGWDLKNFIERFSS